MDARQRLVHADATKVEWSDFDVVVTDPPYRKEVHEKASSHSLTGGVRHREMGFDPMKDSLRAWTCAFVAQAKRWIVVFSDLESITCWKDGLEANGATYVRTIPWVRWSAPQISDDRPPQGAEAIVLAYGTGKGRKHWNGPRNLMSFAHKCLRGDKKHKAEKPLDLALDLVSWFSDPGETVVDPFAGHGTFGLACKLLDRSYVGAELDAEWAQKAMIRMAGGFAPWDEARLGLWKAKNAGSQHVGNEGALGDRPPAG